jgi:hypothetical protein
MPKRVSVFRKAASFTSCFLGLGGSITSPGWIVSDFGVIFRGVRLAEFTSSLGRFRQTGDRKRACRGQPAAAWQASACMVEST